jgi:hypothetical protein
MKKVAFIVSTFIAFGWAHSQNIFVPGYLIRLTGDSIEGDIKINPKKIFENYTKVVYKGDRGTQETYKSDEVKGYVYKDNHFVSYKLNDEQMFFKVLFNGKVMLDEVMFPEALNKDKYQSDYYISKKGDAGFERVTQGKAKKQLAEYMKSNPTVLDGLDDSKFDLGKVMSAIEKYSKS